MFFLQIIKSKEYKTLSDKNSINVIFLEPERGKIIDRNNVQLALSTNNYKLILYREKNTNIEVLLIKLTDIFKWNEPTKNMVAKKMQAAIYLRPTAIVDYVSWDNVCKFEEISYELPGIYIEKGLIRDYVFNDLFAHVIGYMGMPNATEIKNYNLSHYKDFKIGKSGIEKGFERELMGEFGMKKVEVDAYRAIVRELSEQSSNPGKDLKLTIDCELQKFVGEKLKDEWASAVVMDVNSGNVLSMVSTPTFDPNLFSRGISEEQWNSIVNHRSLPLTNKSISKLYPPGSTFKVNIALAILHHGIDPNHKVFCNGAVQINGHTFKCWKKGGHGSVNLQQAIKGSCNCYFYLMGLQAGIDDINYTADLLGIGKLTNINLPNELAGINPTKKWKKKLYGQQWYVGDTVNTCVGQGYVLATPLQIVTMMARIASGNNVFPQLVTNVGGREIIPNKFDKLNIKPEHLELIRAGLEDASNQPGGTSFASRIIEPEFRMAGKTGTAQVISKDTAENRSAFAKHLQSHSIFTGFAPAYAPKYACVVIVDHGGWGAVKAAPIAADILKYAQLNC
jgi:penicillin-binding protein 2